MVSEGDEIDDGTEGTPAPERKGIWTVALQPEFGVGAASSLRVTVTLFGGILLALFVSTLLALAFRIVTALNGTQSFILIVSTIVATTLLPAGFALYRARKRWLALSTPEGVQRTIERYGDEWPDNAHDRANGAVRSVWRPFRRPHWEQLPAAARAFDLPAPRSLVIDPTDRFKSLPRVIAPDMLEPEDVGEHASGAAAKSRALSMGTLAAIVFLLMLVIPKFFQPGFVFQPGQFIAFSIVLLLWLYDVFSPAKGRWIPGLADSVLAAPSLVVVRSIRTTTVFRADDSTLVLSRERQSVRDSRVVITRDDGRRVTLRFAGPEDQRLLTLWTMWNHPRVSRWDPETEQIVPEHNEHAES